MSHRPYFSWVVELEHLLHHDLLTICTLDAYPSQCHLPLNSLEEEEDLITEGSHGRCSGGHSRTLSGTSDRLFPFFMFVVR